LRDALIFFWPNFFLCVDLAKLQDYFSGIGHLVPPCPQAVVGCPFFLVKLFSVCRLSQIARIFFRNCASCACLSSSSWGCPYFFLATFFSLFKLSQITLIFFRYWASRACLSSSSCETPFFFWPKFFLCLDLAKLHYYFSGIGHLVPACLQAVGDALIFFWPNFFGRIF
jgi:hypothetical protein